MTKNKKVKLPVASCYDCFHNNNGGSLKEPSCQFNNKQRFIDDKPFGCSDWVDMEDLNDKN